MIVLNLMILVVSIVAQNINYTSPGSFNGTVPPGKCSISLIARGGRGGRGGNGKGGKAGEVKGTFVVTPDLQYNGVIASHGITSSSSFARGGGGGGSTGFLLGGDLVVIAGGGGGGGGGLGSNGYDGGAGGDKGYGGASNGINGSNLGDGGGGGSNNPNSSGMGGINGSGGKSGAVGVNGGGGGGGINSDGQNATNAKGGKKPTSDGSPALGGVALGGDNVSGNGGSGYTSGGGGYGGGGGGGGYSGGGGGDLLGGRFCGGGGGGNYINSLSTKFSTFSFNGTYSGNETNGSIEIVWGDCFVYPNSITSSSITQNLENNLTLTKSSFVNNMNVIQYQIIVKNNGQNNITNVTLQDTNIEFNQTLCVPSLPTTLQPGNSSICHYSST
jgi:uncharacterized repeat protein (TIGR01451 family)